MNGQDGRGANSARWEGSHRDPAEEHSSPPEKWNGNTVWLALLLIVVGMGLVLGVGWGKIDRGRHCLDSALVRLRVLQEMVPEASTSVGSVNVGAVHIELQGLQGDLACLRTEAGAFLPLAPALRWLPKVGEDISSIPVLLEMAQSLVDGGVLVLDGLSPIVQQVQPGVRSGSTAEGRPLGMAEMTEFVAAAHPQLVEGGASLERAAHLRAMLDAESLSPRLGRLLGLTDRVLPLLRAGVTAAQLAPELLGTTEPRRYLILAQNDDERRPTGGWISGVGLVTVEGGEVTDLVFLDSWAVDNLEVPHEIPPEPMLRFLWAGIWLLRDANWSPDFPTSAQVAEDILERDQGIRVDGVVAVNQAALQLLVSALEPLTLGQDKATVTGATVLDTIRETWAEPEEGLTAASGWQEWEAHRKDFMTDLVAAMLDRVQNQAGDLDLAKLAAVLLQALEQRHILIYLHQEQAAQMLAIQGWDGALREAAGDYFQLVDANLGFNKVDPNVQRTIAYQVDLTDVQRPLAKATVHYRNGSQPEPGTCLQEAEWEPSYAQRMQGCYWDYVRFYVPKGAELLTTDREPLPDGSLLSRFRYAPLGDAGPEVGPVEKDKKAFGLFFVLPPGEERDVDLEWSLPSSNIQGEAGTWRYQLLVQKQSGAPPIPLQVRVLLPLGSQVLAASPGGATILEDEVIFSSSLSIDQHFEVMFEASE